MDPKILEQITTGIPTNGYTEKVDIWSLGTQSATSSNRPPHGDYWGNGG